MTDETLVRALAGYDAEDRAYIRQDARGNAEAAADAAQVGDRGLAALGGVWDAVAELCVHVDSAVELGRVAEAAGVSGVAAAVGRCSRTTRRILLGLLTTRRDDAARRGAGTPADWWATLAAHVADVDATERRALRELEDDALGARGVLAEDDQDGYDA